MEPEQDQLRNWSQISPSGSNEEESDASNISDNSEEIEESDSSDNSKATGIYWEQGAQGGGQDTHSIEILDWQHNLHDYKSKNVNFKE